MSQPNNAKRLLDSYFPNGFQSFLETFYEVVSHIEQDLNEPASINLFTVAVKIRLAGGRAALYELAKEWATEFELQNKGRQWDGDFFEAIENFLFIKNKFE